MLDTQRTEITRYTANSGAGIPLMPPGVAYSLRSGGRHAHPGRARRAGRAVSRAVRWCGRKIRATWDMLPGPTWVKALLIVICLAIPGPGDEIAVLAIAGALAVRKARRAGAR